VEALQAMPTATVKSQKAFEKALEKAFRAADIKLTAGLKKLILKALGERDEEAEVVRDNEDYYVPDPELRDFELVPLKEDIQTYFEREVKPFVPDAWIDETYYDEKDDQTGRVGYEINFNRYFYKYVPPRPLEEIEAELKELEMEIFNLLKSHE
jgi:type I restriction enzyme M protein